MPILKSQQMSVATDPFYVPDGRRSSVAAHMPNTNMHIGHINLAASFNGAGEYFVSLIEALQIHGMQQYVVVRNVDLAKRLEIIDGVTVGPITRSPLTAHCLVPSVDVVHIHDRCAWQAGLLLILTKSIPFVLTDRESIYLSKNPIAQSVYKRAAALIPESDTGVVVEHLAAYRRAVDSLRVPTMLL